MHSLTIHLIEEVDILKIISECVILFIMKLHKMSINAQNSSTNISHRKCEGIITQ